jgi:NADPH:quinone reductase-like Zn-dependent oxidoreductase
MKSKRVVITRHGSPDVLQVVEEDIPEPISGQVRVKILATGAAFTDVLMREGLYPNVPPLPYAPGYDIVGIVDQLGSGVSTLELGQIVVALTITGGYAEFICLPAQELVPVPLGVDPIEACCLPLAYVTAFQMLYRLAEVKPGKRILIHGAAGGVGTALLQLGKLIDLQMYGTASEPKHELVSRLGGIPIDYKHEDFVQSIRELTGDGVDAVFDAIGGNHLWRSYQTLRTEGRLITFGVSSAVKAKAGKSFIAASSFLLLSLLRLIPDGHQALFYSIATYKKHHPNWFREDLIELLKLLAQQKIKPIIAEKIPLLEAVRAHELLDQSAVSGKIVLICNP